MFVSGGQMSVSSLESESCLCKCAIASDWHIKESESRSYALAPYKEEFFTMLFS